VNTNKAFGVPQQSFVMPILAFGELFNGLSSVLLDFRGKGSIAWCIERENLCNRPAAPIGLPGLWAVAAGAAA